MRHFLTLHFVCLTLCCHAQDRIPSLRQSLQDSLKPYHATVGVALINLETGDTLTINNEHHYPMQSVYKFHLVLYLLHLVDSQVLFMGDTLHITKADLRPDTWSPMQDQYPDGVDLPLSQVIKYTISQSDNNGCDILFRLVGGPAKVQEYIRGLGFDKIAIVANEQQTHKHWKVQYKNWTQPYALCQLMKGWYEGKYLSWLGTGFLRNTMEQTSTGPKRIRGLLPPDMVIAHKTGTSGSKHGLQAACNDAGIITLPNGQHLALTVFVSDSRETLETNEHIIAMVARMVVDGFGR